MTADGVWGDDHPTPSTQDRLVFLFCHLVGHVVQAKLKEGVVYEGLCHSIDVEDFSIVMQHARLKQPKVNGNIAKAKTKPKAWLHIPATELVSLFAMEVSLGGQRTYQEGFFTDGDITGHHGLGGMERELQPCSFLTAGASDADLDTEIACYKNNTTWDQFGENARRFGYRTTFDENLYTTRLDHKQFSAKEIREAERLAKEIEKGIGDDKIRHNVQYLMERNQQMERDYDEEELHSSVFRPEPPPRPTPTLQELSSGAPGKYVPPYKRGQQPAPPAPAPLAAAAPPPKVAKQADPTEFMAQAVHAAKPIPATALSSAEVERNLLEPTSAPASRPLLPLYQDTGPICWADECDMEEEEKLSMAASMPLPPPVPPKPAPKLAPPVPAPTPTPAPALAP
eukprot:EG_transcript_15072